MNVNPYECYAPKSTYDQWFIVFKSIATSLDIDVTKEGIAHDLFLAGCTPSEAAQEIHSN